MSDKAEAMRWTERLKHAGAAIDQAIHEEAKRAEMRQFGGRRIYGPKKPRP